MPIIGKPKTNHHNQYKLTSEIIGLSEADNWNEAKLEWQLETIFYADRDEPGACLCGQSPIIENCVLYNRVNGNRAIVGNVCVNRFIGLESAKLFTGVGRILKDSSCSLNAETLEHAYTKGWINDWELQFYANTLKKRRLSPRQMDKRLQINDKILAGFDVGE